MQEHTPNVVGSWEKITQSDCSNEYPDRIQFQENSLYYGQKNPPGTFTQWDVGTYEVVGPRQIRISTANDAIVAYEFSVSEDTINFVDPNGCEFSYQRLSS